MGTRREVLQSVISGLVLSVASGCRTNQARPTLSLRPPGALPERAFLARCIRCGRCGTVCASACIRFSDDLGPDGSTPYIIPQDRACILCLRCGEVCPSGALQSIPEEQRIVAERVRMGTAELDPELCWAHGGRGICRACWYACPFADDAIVLQGPLLQPQIIEDRCVGCGLCAQACPPEAQAMTIRPRST